MRSKIFGGILTAMGIIGMVSLGLRFTGRTWEVALFVIFALFTADGVTNIVSDCRSWSDEKYKTPEFLDEYMEDRDEE